MSSIHNFNLRDVQVPLHIAKPMRFTALSMASNPAEEGTHEPGRVHFKRVWVGDLWHLRNRILRAILMHTMCVWLNQHDEASCLQLDRLVT